ncbi:conjugal transfer transcriptional regulator TraJ [Vibrio alginolyticus]|uniref:Conjugal transfer transcriptional regulator TraJ n=1 Tax=Vibrio anguillarum TaxID=55601 RepID=A0AAW4BK36_VIBAN|nr:conjugal transfer transcriptional regulator TraJ [Vibrio alginolyticus]MBF4435253.1 conjugal transfer transcriptional regulator TraJ [Vibrio anguillarum]
MSHAEKVTRKNTTPIKVYCLPEERERIEANAKQAGLSVSTYLRRIGQGHQVKSVVDTEQVRELVKVNGDLGRLGGLLKLWLTNDVKAAQIGVPTIKAVLNRIDTTKDQMSTIMESVLRQR